MKAAVLYEAGRSRGATRTVSLPWFSKPSLAYGAFYFFDVKK